MKVILKATGSLHFAAGVLLVLLVLSFTSCTPKVRTEDHGLYSLVIQKGGPTLGYSPASGVGIIMDGGHAFKDLDRDGELDSYEDWRLPLDTRAEDLASKLSIEEIAGLMLYSAHQSIPSASMNGFGSSPTYGGKPYGESGAAASDLSDQQKKFLSEDNLRAVLITSVESPEVAAKWNNNMQAFVEGLGHGVPSNTSSDPRNETDATAEFNLGSGGKISLWPTSLGLAATFDPALVKRFGEIASKEYRALGIATALSPQVDIATDPRWNRFSGTFGEDVNLSTDMARAYCDGFQTSPGNARIEGAWGYLSVNAMVKHWYGYGAQEGGRDSHFNYGKYAVYPGDNREMHKLPFTKGAFNLEDGTLSASAVMPIYSILFNQDPSGKNVGGSYSEWMIEKQLRGVASFDGVVCTDWAITGDNNAVGAFDGKPWGVEKLSVAQRHYQILKAGVDQFGGNNDKGPVLEAYRMWVEDFGEESAQKRFRASAKRLLMNSFRTGLFENPYLDPERSGAIVGNADFMKEGYEAQLRSIVMLKNRSNSVLPISASQDNGQGKLKVYIPKRHYAPTLDFWGMSMQGEDKWDYPVSLDLVKKYYTVVEDPCESDFALVMIQAPKTGNGYSSRTERKDGKVTTVPTQGNGYVPISLQWGEYTAVDARDVSIAGGDPLENFTNRSYRGRKVSSSNADEVKVVRDTRKAMGEKPVVLVLAATRPVVLAEVEPYCDALLLTLGVQDQAVLDMVSGKAEPSGLLPMQMPSGMKTVELQNEDVPRDMECYKDSEGNVYDFAFGLGWNGVISDDRVKKYR